eukprot:tig00021312_g20091.t1
MQAAESESTACAAEDRDTIVMMDVARLCARFGERVERLHLGDIDVHVSAASEIQLELGNGILRHCPNLTHLSLADCAVDVSVAVDRFSLPRLRHLDLSGLAVPFPSLRRLLGACSATLECLYLRGARVYRDRASASFGSDDVLPSLDGLSCNFPCLQSLDLSSTDVCVDVAGLRALLARLPQLKDLYVVGSGRQYIHPERLAEAKKLIANEFCRPGRLVVCKSLLEMDATSLRALRAHFDGTAAAHPRPDREGERLTLARLAVPAFFKALSPRAFNGSRGLEEARRLVEELGVSPRARLEEARADRWAPPYFRDVPAWLCKEGWTPLHLLASSSRPADAQQLIVEWELAPFVNVPLPAGCGRGLTPLLLAVENSPGLVEALLEHGADLFYQDAYANGATALHKAFTGMPGRPRARVARTLLQAAARQGLGIDVLFARDGTGRGPLDWLLCDASPQEAGDGGDRYQKLSGDPLRRVGQLDRIHREEQREAESVRQDRSMVAAHAIGKLERPQARPRPFPSPQPTGQAEVLGLTGGELEALGVRPAFLEEARWGRQRREPLLFFAARECTPAAVRALLDAGADPCISTAGGATLLQFCSAEVRGVLLDFAAARSVPLDRLGGSRPAAGPRPSCGKRARPAASTYRGGRY